jgi:hydroxymethylpyrimidine pyrophosphatase-like HAD family hydrolase
MGNAAEELRRDGWTVTLPNDQNGVAAAIEQVMGAGSL